MDQGDGVTAGLPELPAEARQVAASMVAAARAALAGLPFGAEPQDHGLALDALASAEPA